MTKTHSIHGFDISEGAIQNCMVDMANAMCAAVTFDQMVELLKEPECKGFVENIAPYYHDSEGKYGLDTADREDLMDCMAQILAGRGGWPANMDWSRMTPAEREQFTKDFARGLKIRKIKLSQ